MRVLAVEQAGRSEQLELVSQSGREGAGRARSSTEGVRHTEVPHQYTETLSAATPMEQASPTVTERPPPFRAYAIPEQEYENRGVAAQQA
jgi:hypothetical protein